MQTVSDQELAAALGQEQSAPPPEILGQPPPLPKTAEAPRIGLGRAQTGLNKGQAGPAPPTGFMDQLQQYPGWTGTALRAAIPQTPTEGILDLLNLGMFGPGAPEATVAEQGAGRAALSAVRNLGLLKKLGIGAATGAGANYLQGESPVGGAAQGGLQTLGGKAGDVVGNYFGEKSFAKAAKFIDPRRIAKPLVEAAPWLGEIIGKDPVKWTHLDYKRLFQQPGGEKAVGEKFREGLGAIISEANRLTNDTPAFGSAAIQKLDPARKDTTISLQEAFDTIQDLRSGGYVRGIEAKGGMSAGRLRDIRRELVDETEQFLNRISGDTLGAAYGDLRKNMGRSMAFMRLFNAKDITRNSKVDTGLLEDRWLNQKQLGLDIEDWLDKPQEFDAVERALFRGGDPTTPDVAPQAGGAHFYATPSLKPHGYFKLGKPGSSAGYTGSPLGGATGAYGVGRGIGGAEGEWAQQQPEGQPQDVVMPDTPGTVQPGADLSPAILQAIKAHPDLQGLSEEEIRALYQQALARQ